MVVLIFICVLNKVSITLFLGSPGIMAWLEIWRSIDPANHLWTTFPWLLWLKRMSLKVRWSVELELITGLMQVYKLDGRLLNLIRCKLGCRRADRMDHAVLLWRYSYRLRDVERVWSSTLMIELLCLFNILPPSVIRKCVILILVFYLRFGDLNRLILLRKRA